jgi:hypothetical protein
MDTSRRVVQAYYQAVFAGRPPDAAFVARLATEVAALERPPARTRRAGTEGKRERRA